MPLNISCKSYYTRDVEDVCRVHNTLSPPWEIAKCDTTKTSESLLIKVGSRSSSITEDNVDMFIGFGAEAHLGVGGHVKIGFSVKRFFDVLINGTEEYE